jgi:CheY-like chemotaxis protein
VAAHSEASSRSQPLTVWLIEDNPTDVFVMKEALKQSGLEHTVQVAPDGEAALSLLRGIENEENTVPPALVLLDLNLPKTSGTDVLAAIRTDARCARVPVIIVTSSDSPDDLRAIQALNATAYFRKPTELSAFMKLSDVIRQVLSGPPDPLQP